MSKNISWTISEAEAVDLSMEDGAPSRLTEALAELEDANHTIVFATENLVSSGDKQAVLGTLTYYEWHTCACLIHVQFSPIGDGSILDKSEVNESFLNLLPDELEDVVESHSALFDYVFLRQAATKSEAIRVAVDVTRKLNLAAQESLEHIPVGHA